MTPAVLFAKKNNIEFTLHQYEHDPHHQSFGLEAAEKLNLAACEVFKTLVIELDNHQLAVAILPVTHQLNLKLVAKALGMKKAQMAEPQKVERTTGYVLGGVSPLGQKKRLSTVIDSSAQQLESLYISGGRRGLEIQLAPNDLQQVLNAQFAPLCQ
ncbi:Cys-tRNA(Pro) deacylase [Pseudoalteromonas tunicata]|uniref:Cys-tRNA(Pro)/Cys-tRNA(Cys) deacylase n=1 Tax=Pseudoalteromonas tunicata D2 TaxID=87626 RepID=A4C4M4_9GAMM|nr:Cys-tRNA(Pro) deacylase [Pseudoalteromonas tunicata]ATC97015.1 putative transcription regulator [Pseudoalteromonas tunicata]AXT33135.1 Cys-tRNA(Pro) deacylase [Pseudoalteromonas tunicata]EAR30506.1 regulatory protein [Pseudoalteromonas tunicata D2]MDP4984879.1 Cys-tRNA(Pro) deacylase [Pseudoalteromonas tunicata]